MAAPEMAKPEPPPAKSSPSRAAGEPRKSGVLGSKVESQAKRD